MTDLNKLVRENVLKLVPYSCARDEYKGSAGIFLDANENPYGTLNRYPDPYQNELRRAVSEFRGIHVENVFLGNGSDEIIDICYRVFCNPGKDKVLLFPPTYGMYEVSAGVNDVDILKVPLDDEFRINTATVTPLLSDENLKLVFICSPNNPTGNAMDRKDVEFILENFRGIVVVDEAYIDFCDKPSFAQALNRYGNLIVMQTFSKAMGLAAARVGIAFTSEEIVKLFNRIKPPYNISTINQKAALAVLKNRNSFNSRVDKILRERNRLINALNKLEAVEKVYRTDANFMLIKTPDADALYRYLVDKQIIVRNRNSIIRNCVRITVGTKRENDELLRAIKEYRP